MGPPRHLDLLGDVTAERIEWPVPFSDGIARLKGLAGRRVVVLASGDPFWFGAGSVIAREFNAGDWVAHPVPSVFALAAARLGWPIEKTLCIGLHAAPLSRLRPHLADGAQAIVLLRDGAAVHELSAYLSGAGFGASALWVMEALGGPREKIIKGHADALGGDFTHPVCVGVRFAGGYPLTLASGRADAVFESDGVMTKRPVRAITLSTLAPRRGEHLWDIGGGSGTIAIEWLLSDPSLSATAIEVRADRADLIRRNAMALGQDRLNVVEARVPDGLDDLPRPDAVFVGGGLSDALLDHLLAILPKGTRLVANAVTLESEVTVARWHEKLGGELLRIELSDAAPLGPRRGWKAAYPVVQWSVTL